MNEHRTQCGMALGQACVFFFKNTLRSAVGGQPLAVSSQPHGSTGHPSVSIAGRQSSTPDCRLLLTTGRRLRVNGNRLQVFRQLFRGTAGPL